MCPFSLLGPEFPISVHKEDVVYSPGAGRVASCGRLISCFQGDKEGSGCLHVLVVT